ncbi:MAG: type III pantothenate kinase [Gammaproteobacteria bacterium]
MNLLIDAGNSRIKWALCDDATWTVGQPFEWSGDQLDRQLAAQFVELPQVRMAWISNVGGPLVEEALRRVLNKKIASENMHFVRSAPRLGGIVNLYTDPTRLGVDRLIAMVAAFQRYRAPVCVADCGTALTVDLVDADGHFRGGIIAPGPMLMRRSLASGTRQLPTVDDRNSDVLALSTEHGIAAGCVRAAAGAIALAYAEFSKRLGVTPHCILTGGDAPLVLPSLSFAYDHDPDLVLKGLALLVDGLT